jgi:hypothetical protein
MGFMNKILFDIAYPPQVTDATKITDNAGGIPVIILLSVAAAAVAAAVILLVFAARKKHCKA